MLQNLVVVLLVSIAFAYSAWVLMPAAWRGGLRRRLGGPGAGVVEAGGCGGCGGGCGSAARRPTPGAGHARNAGGGTAVITVHRRAAPAAGVTPRQDESAGASAP